MALWSSPLGPLVSMQSENGEDGKLMVVGFTSPPAHELCGDDYFEANDLRCVIEGCKNKRSQDHDNLCVMHLPARCRVAKCNKAAKLSGYCLRHANLTKREAHAEHYNHSSMTSKTPLPMNTRLEFLKHAGEKEIRPSMTTSKSFHSLSESQHGRPVAPRVVVFQEALNTRSPRASGNTFKEHPHKRRTDKSRVTEETQITSSSLFDNFERSSGSKLHEKGQFVAKEMPRNPPSSRQETSIFLKINAFTSVSNIAQRRFQEHHQSQHSSRHIKSRRVEEEVSQNNRQAAAFSFTRNARNLGAPGTDPLRNHHFFPAEEGLFCGTTEHDGPARLRLSNIASGAVIPATGNPERRSQSSLRTPSEITSSTAGSAALLPSAVSSCDGNGSKFEEASENFQGKNRNGSPQKQKRGRECSVEGCGRQVRSRGLCKSHGGGKRCSVAHCDKSVQGGTLCMAHGGGKRCLFIGCQKSAQSRGRCKAHGGGERCKFTDCNKSSQGGGFCRAHGGGKRCMFDGCSKGTQRGDFCARHGGSRVCIYQNCQKVDRGGGFCNEHGGEKRCLYIGCSKLARYGGACLEHFSEIHPQKDFRAYLNMGGE